MSRFYSLTAALLASLLLLQNSIVAQDLAIIGEQVHPVSSAMIPNGVVLIRDGKIAAIGPLDQIGIPADVQVLKAKIVTPGLIDARSTVGLSGMLNQDGDQDQLDHSTAMQPQLRAIDAVNVKDELFEWIRGFGVTTVHTGHAPGELISGQTLVTKTVGNRIEDCLIQESTAVAATLTSSARKSGSGEPGTRGKMISMLRSALIEAQEYQSKIDNAKDDEAAVAVNLKLEALTKVLKGELKLMIAADKAQDIASALRLAEEFKLQIWLDSASECYLLLDEIKAANAAVIIHPTMARATGDRENLSFETASKLAEAGIPFVFQSGYEPYVPKTRVVLFEAGLAAAHGLGMERTLKAVTLDAAKLLGIEKRVGSLAVGKDADIALFDGDPFEYTTHCVGVVIDGNVVSEVQR